MIYNKHAVLRGDVGIVPYKYWVAYSIGADAHIRPLEQCGDPINKAIDYAGGHAVDDDGAGDGARWERRRWRSQAT